MASKQTIAKEITKDTRKAVWIRQRGRSLFAPYREITEEMCCCHFVSRGGNDRNGKTGSGGVGYEWNIFGCYQTPWIDEHYDFDHGKKVANLDNDEAISVVRNHLMSSYANWSLEKCRYNKGWEKEDYEVIPRDKRP